MGAMEMPLPENTLPMMTGYGQFGPMEMGGMFSVVRVRGGSIPTTAASPSIPEPQRHGRPRIRRRRPVSKGMALRLTIGWMMCQSNDHSWFSWLRFC
jgi:hypothetical protein